MKKKIALVVGGTGQIGVYLSKFLLSKDYRVFVTSRKLKKQTYEKFDLFKIKKNVKFINLNIFDFHKINQLLLKITPNEIYYLAGQSSLKKSFLRINKNNTPTTEKPIIRIKAYIKYSIKI